MLAIINWKVIAHSGRGIVKYVKKYKKYLTKKNVGRKVTVK